MTARLSPTITLQWPQRVGSLSLGGDGVLPGSTCQRSLLASALVDIFSEVVRPAAAQAESLMAANRYWLGVLMNMIIGKGFPATRTFGAYVLGWRTVRSATSVGDSSECKKTEEGVVNGKLYGLCRSFLRTGTEDSGIKGRIW